MSIRNENPPGHLGGNRGGTWLSGQDPRHSGALLAVTSQMRLPVSRG